MRASNSIIWSRERWNAIGERCHTFLQQMMTRSRYVKLLAACLVLALLLVALIIPPVYTKNRASRRHSGKSNDADFFEATPSTLRPTEFTHSILPELDDDDVISNSQDNWFDLFESLQENASSVPSHSPLSDMTEPPAAETPGTMLFSEVQSFSSSEAPSISPSEAMSLNHPSHVPSYMPSQGDSVANIEPTVSFVPGLLTTLENGLLLSEGLTARLIAESGLPVEYQNVTYGVRSTVDFHGMPDFGATFEDTRPFNPNGWIYVSNSEMEDQGTGAVGGITFDQEGKVLRYEHLVTGTTMNCGGGKTPWNTWITCEETEGGKNYQVDPLGQRQAMPITLGQEGGHWESFAYDIRDMSAPHFFVTEDSPRGALQRFTPHNVSWDSPEDSWAMLHGTGTIEYLLLQPDSTSMQGTFSWSKNRAAARTNANQFYPNSEGIDVYQGRLYFVCKKIKQLFELDLDSGTYTRQSTTSGLFDGGPDQLKRILTGGMEDFLFFTEEGGKDAGIHGRDSSGMFFTVLESPVYIDESTGLAFSPNYKHLYVGYQKNGLLFDITRKDGLPFFAKSLNVKYHAT